MPRRQPRCPNIGLLSCRPSMRSASFSGDFFSLLANNAISWESLGRNSCMGGSSRRTIIGLSWTVWNIWKKSFSWKSRSLLRASFVSSSESAKMRRRISRIRSCPKNMCSVRARPTPLAPKFIAVVKSLTVSALART